MKPRCPLTGRQHFAPTDTPLVMACSSERRLRQLHAAMCPSASPASAAMTAATTQPNPTVKVCIFGAGGHARRAHAPNLRTLPGVEIVAIADANLQLAQQLADDFAPAARCYSDGHEMLAAEPELHALFSVVPAFVRAAGVEAAAAAKGIHIFSEKPQTLDMATARSIAAAIKQAGVVSSVGFRERYRPLFRAARDYLADKEVVHVSFRSFSGVPKPKPMEIKSWHDDFSKMGGTMFDWGCHAVDYVRFMTGEDIASAQAWYNHPEQYLTPLSASVNFLLTNGATMTSTFVSSGQFDREPWFVIHFVGGTLALYGYDRMEVNTGGGAVIEYSAAEDLNPDAPSDGYVRGVGYDPWCAHACPLPSTLCTTSWCQVKESDGWYTSYRNRYEQDRCFVEDVRDALVSASGSTSSPSAARLVNDYADGLLSLGPVLAGWESARRGGSLIDVRSFVMEETVVPAVAETP